MVVKVSCPECGTITDYKGEVKEKKLITCSNPNCFTPNGKRRRIKVIHNVIPSDTDDTNKKTSENPKESKQEQSDTKMIPNNGEVIPSDTNDTLKKTSENPKESKQEQSDTKLIPSDTSDTNKSVSRIIEILENVLDIKTGVFWSFHQTMSTRRAFPKEVLSKFQKICLELRKELDKIEKID